MGKLKDFFFVKEGGKRRLDKNAAYVLSGLSAVPILLLFIFGKKEEAASTVATSSLPFIGRGAVGSGKKTGASPPKGVGLKKEEAKRPRQKKSPKRPIRFSAVQVIERGRGTDENALPVGTTAVGRLLTPVDTRARGAGVRVVLPYGMGRKGKPPLIPKGSVLLGSPSEGGAKIFLRFDRAVFPDGREAEISAHALGSEDYSVGLAGERHDNAALKTAAVLALTMTAGMGEVLAEKQALGGEYGGISVKSTLKDATLTGLSRAAESEARRRTGRMEMEAEGEYRTVREGTAFIVSLTQTFKMENFKL